MRGRGKSMSCRPNSRETQQGNNSRQQRIFFDLAGKILAVLFLSREKAGKSFLLNRRFLVLVIIARIQLLCGLLMAPSDL
jgi:hypothetical protein